jgi:hypothetical protein
MQLAAGQRACIPAQSTIIYRHQPAGLRRIASSSSQQHQRPLLALPLLARPSRPLHTLQCKATPEDASSSEPKPGFFGSLYRCAHARGIG